MCLVLGTQRLGEPLARTICAYRGGTAWGLLLLMQELIDAVPTKKRLKTLPPRQKPAGVDLLVLEKEQVPPPDAILLQEVDFEEMERRRKQARHSGKEKFAPKVSSAEGVSIIEIPLDSPSLKPKRRRVTAGMIFAMVWRGNHWRDRSGVEHHEPY